MSEWARPHEGPRQRNALEILRPPTPEEYTEPALNKVWGPMVGGVLGFGLFVFTNYGQNRPLLSGIQRHITAAVGLGTLLHYVFEYRRGYYAERDAILRHYVELHPEEFIYPVRKRYSEVLQPWVPIR